MTSARATTNVLAGTVTRYGLLIANIATGAVLMPYTVHHLGQSQYGLWMMVASVTAYFSLLDLGYGNGVVKHLVDADARGDVTRMNAIASTFVCVYSMLALVAAAVAAVIIVLVVPRLPGLRQEEVTLAQGVVAILCTRVAIGLPMTVFGAITNARQGFVINNVIAIGLVLINAVVTWAVLSAGGGLLALVSLTTLASIVGYGAYAWSAYHAFPELRIRVAAFSQTEWRHVTAFSLYLFVIGLASQLSFNVDNLVVGGVLGTAAVAVYTVAVRLSEYQRRLCDQFSGMLFPVVVGYRTSGAHDAVRTAMVEGATVALLLVTAVTIPLVGFALPLVARWMGPGFEESIPALNVLAAVGVVMVSHGAQQAVLLASGRQRLVACVWLAEGAANLVLSLVFVKWWGGAGVALGTLIPVLFGHVGVLTPAACRAVDLAPGQFVRRCAMPSAIGALPAVLVCVAMRSLYPPASLWAVLIEGSACVATFAAAVVSFGIDSQTRATYVMHVRSALASLLPGKPIATSTEQV